MRFFRPRAPVQGHYRLDYCISFYIPTCFWGMETRRFARLQAGLAVPMSMHGTFFGEVRRGRRHGLVSTKPAGSAYYYGV